jgi:hypothetical protein
VAWPLKKRPVFRVARILRLLACVIVGLLLTVPLYVGLAKSGVIRSPFFPRVEGDLALARSEREGLRVLFVGNSFTYYNSMPSLVHRLAEADPEAPALFVVEYTAPNWTLREASSDDGLADLLEDIRWNVVVLQEQSQLLSFSAEWRHRETSPFVRVLDREIRVAGGRTMFFVTWGYREGDQRNWPGDTYAGMQARLTEGYHELAIEVGARVAPVGRAWAEALRRRPGLQLWSHDGRHPGRLGSYLAACVFYATLSGRDPSGSAFTAGLDEGDARLLQDVAGDVVGRLVAAA